MESWDNVETPFYPVDVDVPPLQVPTGPDGSKVPCGRYGTAWSEYTILYAHYFLLHHHWFVAEHCGVSHDAFCWVDLGDWRRCGWMHLSLERLREMRVKVPVKDFDGVTRCVSLQVQRDLKWEPTRYSDLAVM